METPLTPEDDKARFLAAVEKGIAAAERGEFIEERRWTPASSGCSSLNPNALDRSRRDDLRSSFTHIPRAGAQLASHQLP